MSTVKDAENHGAHHVYRCYADNDLLLYVGCAQNVDTRMFHHLSLCNRGKQPNGILQRYMVRHTVTTYPTRLAARQAEREAISTEAPLLNKQHNPLRFRKGVGGVYFAVAPIHPLIDEAFDAPLVRSIA